MRNLWYVSISFMRYVIIELFVIYKADYSSHNISDAVRNSTIFYCKMLFIFILITLLSIV